MAKGKKVCPGCKAECGPRTLKCSCGHEFMKGVESKVPVAEIKVPVDEIKIPVAEIKIPVAEIKVPVDEIKVHMAVGQGKKVCDGCKNIIGAAAKTCKICGFVFSLKKKYIVEQEDANEIVSSEGKNSVDSTPIVSCNNNSVDVKEIDYSTVKTKEEPRFLAEKILSKGYERAKFLLNYAQKHNCWSHIDWEFIKSQLSEIEDIEEMAAIDYSDEETVY